MTRPKNQQLETARPPPGHNTIEGKGGQGLVASSRYSLGVLKVLAPPKRKTRHMATFLLAGSSPSGGFCAEDIQGTLSSKLWSPETGAVAVRMGTLLLKSVFPTTCELRAVPSFLASDFWACAAAGFPRFAKG